MSCFHINSSREEHDKSSSNNELELMKQRIESLESRTDGGDHGGFGNLMSRVSHLEETFQAAQEETQAEIKGSYQSVSGAWQTLTQVQKRMALLEGICRRQSEQLERAGKELLDLRNRQLELLDSDESLEERIERLEGGEITAPASRAVSRRGSLLGMSAPSGHFMTSSSSLATADLRRRRSSTTRPSIASGRAVKIVDVLDSEMDTNPLPEPRGPWTVHVSLVPTKEQQRPFEKDTVAYKRCLSRGLQRMVVVADQDAISFSEAISATFKTLLLGRPWEPLQARPLDATIGQDTLTIQPLDAGLAAKDFNAKFLRRNCAVCDGTGRMESLYIALRDDHLGWDFIRQQSVYLDGLESAWDSGSEEALDLGDAKGKFGGIIDAGSVQDDQIKKSEGAHRIVTAETLAKRRASIGFVDAESPQSKMARTSCQPERIELRRGVWTSL